MGMCVFFFFFFLTREKHFKLLDVVRIAEFIQLNKQLTVVEFTTCGTSGFQVHVLRGEKWEGHVLQDL